VVNVLDGTELQAAWQCLHESLANSSGVKMDNLVHTGHQLRQLSSTNGSGGVLDIFYDPWKLSIATNPTLFALTTELWEGAYCHRGERKDDPAINDRFRWHQYGAFDCHKGYMYIDHIGYRLPRQLAEQLGAPSKKKTRLQPLQ
jgi:hypothetical protein